MGGMNTIEIPDNLLFYKYRPGAGDNDMHLEAITKCHVWFENPSNFNDPFDCAPTPSERSTEEIHAVIQRAMSNTENPHMTAEIRESIQKKYAENPAEAVKTVEQLSGRPEYVTAFMSNYVVYSLAKSPLNRLMWSHYAHYHQGFSIEFDFSKDLLKDPRLRTIQDWDDDFGPLPVIYQENRPSIHNNNGNQADVLRTKDSVWEYENEFRIVKEGNRRLVSFDPDYLSSIILGANASNELKTKIQDAVYEFNRDRQTTIKVYYAELSPTKYDLMIPGHPTYENIN